jgi:hypothetical protein
MLAFPQLTQVREAEEDSIPKKEQIIETSGSLGGWAERAVRIKLQQP